MGCGILPGYEIPRSWPGATAGKIKTDGVGRNRLVATRPTSLRQRYNATRRDRSVRVRQAYFNADNNDSRDRYISRCVLRKGLAEPRPRPGPPTKPHPSARGGVSQSKPHPTPPHGEVY